MLSNIKVGLAVTGSFCNFKYLDSVVLSLKEQGVKKIIPIISNSIKQEINRFSTPKIICNKLVDLTGEQVIDTISKAEPIGPNSLIDVLLIYPCSGNTLGKLANGITDTPVLMAYKSHVRNNKPVVIGISTNDGLGTSFENISKLYNQKNIYFVPFYQDNYILKPKSLVCAQEKIIDTLVCAMDGEQIQPVLLSIKE